MADGEFPRPVPSRVQAHPRDTRRQGLRFELGQTHDRGRADRLDDRATLRAHLRSARLQQGADQADDGALRSTALRPRATEPVLTNACRPRVGAAFVDTTFWGWNLFTGARRIG